VAMAANQVNLTIETLVVARRQLLSMESTVESREHSTGHSSGCLVGHHWPGFG